MALVARIRGLACLAMTLGLGALAACARPPSPAIDSVAATSLPAGAAPSAAQFDAGPVRSAAEYLAEPKYTSADLSRGQLLSLACAACHTLNAGGGTLVGPNLHGVFGRPAASVAGFDYSPALASSGLVWTPASLDAWLREPASFVDGTKMAFTGYRAADDRRDLIAYLLHATE